MSFRYSSISHLKACKSIKFTFNPWLSGAKSIREFYHNIFNPGLRSSNDKCNIQFDIRSDQVEPHFEVVYNDDSKALFKTKDLTFSDINRVFQKLSNIKYVEKESKEKN